MEISELSKYKYFTDERTPQQINEQHVKVKQLTDINLNRFNSPKIDYNIPMVKNGVSDVIKYDIKKAQFEDGVYCYYTDNKDECQQFQVKIVVFAVPGLPGTLREWRFLHQAIGKNFCRWINFIPPGVDKEDERRGKNFSATIFQVRDLILKLINYLKIDKIIIMAHSFGTFPTNCFAVSYPERVNGIINLGSPALTASFQPKAEEYYNEENADYKQRIKYLDNDEFRVKKFQRYQKSRDKLESQLKRMFNYTIHEYIYFYKIYLSYDNGFTEYYKSIRNFKQPILRFLCGGSNDNIIDPPLTEEMLYFFTYGENSWKNLSKNRIKYNSENIRRIGKIYESQMNTEDLQQNFIFFLEGAPHLLHIRCVDILAKPLKCYLQIVENLEESNSIVKPSL